MKEIPGYRYLYRPIRGEKRKAAIEKQGDTKSTSSHSSTSSSQPAPTPQWIAHILRAYLEAYDGSREITTLRSVVSDGIFHALGGKILSPNFNAPPDIHIPAPRKSRTQPSQILKIHIPLSAPSAIRFYASARIRGEITALTGTFCLCSRRDKKKKGWILNSISHI